MIDHLLGISHVQGEGPEMAGNTIPGLQGASQLRSLDTIQVAKGAVDREDGDIRLSLHSAFQPFHIQRRIAGIVNGDKAKVQNKTKRVLDSSWSQSTPSTESFQCFCFTRMERINRLISRPSSSMASPLSAYQMFKSCAHQSVNGIFTQRSPCSCEMRR